MTTIARHLLFVLVGVSALLFFAGNPCGADPVPGKEVSRITGDAYRTNSSADKKSSGFQRPQMPKTPNTPKLPETPKGFNRNTDVFGPQAPVRPQAPIN